MTDVMSQSTRSALMSRIRGKDTSPELAVRQLTHRLGFRFRLHRRDLPGTPDLVLPKLKKAVLVHGCFWHRHEGCKNAVLPKTRQEWWQAKLSGNVARDARNTELLASQGWDVLILWECEIRSGDFGIKLAAFLGAEDRLTTLVPVRAAPSPRAAPRGSRQQASLPRPP